MTDHCNRLVFITVLVYECVCSFFVVCLFSVNKTNMLFHLQPHCFTTNFMSCYRKWRSSFTFSLFLNLSQSPVVMPDTGGWFLSELAVMACLALNVFYLSSIYCKSKQPCHGRDEPALCWWWEEINQRSLPGRDPAWRFLLSLCYYLVISNATTKAWDVVLSTLSVSVSVRLIFKAQHPNILYPKWSWVCVCPCGTFLFLFCSLALVSKCCICECQVTTPGSCPTLVRVYIATEHTPSKPHSVI